MDEAKSQSYAKTPRLDHISQLEVFAHWIPEALQADAESVVKSFRAKMGFRVGALKRAASARQQDANEKSNSGDGDTYSWGALFDWSFVSKAARAGGCWQVFHVLSLAFG